MEFISEKDLEYFREKAKKGEVLIVKVDPVTLLTENTRKKNRRKDDEPEGFL